MVAYRFCLVALLFVAAPAVAAPNLSAEEIVRTEWAKAANRRDCAPLAFSGQPARGAAPRRAVFSGGWAVAFDRPGLRSAFGLAGPGPIAEDRAPVAERRARIAAQWPYGRELDGRDLPRGSFAGYGLEGAEAYTRGQPEGVGANSLAYVIVPGQACTYNVWSRLGRSHLETLLDSLRLLPRQ